MDFENTSVEMQEVADPTTEDIENSAVETTETSTEQGENTQEVADPVKNDTNAHFADMRRKQELEQARAEKAELQLQLDYAKQALSQYFDGENLSDLSDNAMAQALGLSQEEYKAQREREQATRNEQALLTAELERYRQKEVQENMDRDLKAIQKIDPTVTSLNDVDPMFLAFRFNETSPMSAEQAFIATRETLKQTKAAKPASIGSVKGSGNAENEFFTQREVDRLTKKDLDNPKIMEKVFKSMERW